MSERVKRSRSEVEWVRVSQAKSANGRAQFETYPGRKQWRIDHLESDGRIVLSEIIDRKNENKHRVYALYLDSAPDDAIYAWIGTRDERSARRIVKMWLNTPGYYIEIKRALLDEDGCERPWHPYTIFTGTQAACKEYLRKCKSPGSKIHLRYRCLTRPGNSAELRKKKQKEKDQVRAEADLVRLRLHSYVKHLGFDDADVDTIFWHLWKIASVDDIVTAIQAHYGIDPSVKPTYDGVRPGFQQATDTYELIEPELIDELGVLLADDENNHEPDYMA